MIDETLILVDGRNRAVISSLATGRQKLTPRAAIACRDPAQCVGIVYDHPQVVNFDACALKLRENAR
jgi:hypothetical protein